jgi:hypothetical protein
LGTVGDYFTFSCRPSAGENELRVRRKQQPKTVLQIRFNVDFIGAPILEQERGHGLG